ncbi:Uncharacterized protein FKW44_015736 [Caligus rogercresseyi]|uniref:Uncharacterized protein n=1 Tax=Caligus rogercresseyi TaxID=217165 RepID=A0A7T8H0S6_CALRO|nr:Uncharacterized protein FKW44_015736 [Caligus rogercresseyi]
MRCSFPSVREESIGGDRVLQLPKSTVYDQWKAWNSFKKNNAHRKKHSRSLGANRTDEFVAEVKRKVNEDGNKSYAKLAAEMGCSNQTIANTINKDLGYNSCMVENKTNKHAHNTLDSLRAAIVEEFANMKKDVVTKAMVVTADGGYIKK